jgi:hypothetical protein
MGLDTVELVMEMEDRFGISIPDEDASRMVTVGDTLDYIVRKLQHRLPGGEDRCPSQRAFYRLRRDLVAAYGVPPRSVRPGSRIGALIPVGPARGTWTAFAQRLRLPLESTRLPRDYFPHPETTLRELVPPMLGPTFSMDGKRVHEHAVWIELRSIISRQLGIDEGEIQPHLRYIADLHCD